MEKQLLFLLDYDLRYDEEEACIVFGPFMPVRMHHVPTPLTPEQQETRAAAVDCVTRAGKARAHAQLPPTPPHEATSGPSIVSSNSVLVSTVRSIARRLSSSALGSVSSRHNSESAEATKVGSPRNSTLSSSSSSTCSSISVASWDMDSLIYDNESSLSDSDSPQFSKPEGDMENLNHPPSRFVLKPVPAKAYRRQGRKVSDTSSIGTVRDEDNPCEPSPTMPSTRRTAFELPASNRTGPRASSSVGQMQSFEHDATTDISLSTTTPRLPRIKESVSCSGHGAGSFLSRMWVAATKAQEKVEAFNSKTSWAPAISIVEPKETHPHGTSAFRRLVHSRSAVFRNSDV